MAENLENGIDGLLAETQRRHEARRATAAAEYRQIVKRADKPQKNDAEKVLDLLPTLGRSFEQFKADVAAWQQYLRHQKAVVPDSELDKLQKSVSDAIDAAEKQKADAEKEAARLSEVWNEASRQEIAARSGNRNAAAAMESLRKQYPHLFDAAAPAA